MLILVVGEIFGNIRSFYDSILSLENREKLQIDWVLSTGDFGIWPDPIRVDRTTRKMGYNADFARMYINQEPVPRKTVFIGGKHEDWVWLNYVYSRGQMELIPGLTWLVNGYKTYIGTGEEQVSVVGLGKVFSSTSYKSLTVIDKRKWGHYTRSEVEKACSHDSTDILLTHEGPSGVRLGDWTSEAEGISNICAAIKPKMLFHSHFDCSKEYVLAGSETPVRSLARGEMALYSWEKEKVTKIT